MKNKFPKMEDRRYGYKEIRKLCEEFKTIDATYSIFLLAQLQYYEADINYLTSRGSHKIQFYSPTLDWFNIILIVDNEPVTLAQRERYSLQNTVGLKYSAKTPGLSIPVRPQQWAKELGFFLARHEN